MYDQLLFSCYMALLINGEAYVAPIQGQSTFERLRQMIEEDGGTHSIRMCENKPGYCEVYLKQP